MSLSLTAGVAARDTYFAQPPDRLLQLYLATNVFSPFFVDNFNPFRNRSSRKRGSTSGAPKKEKEIEKRKTNTKTKTNTEKQNRLRSFLYARLNSFLPSFFG